MTGTASAGAAEAARIELGDDGSVLARSAR